MNIPAISLNQYPEQKTGNSKAKNINFGTLISLSDKALDAFTPTSKQTARVTKMLEKWIEDGSNYMVDIGNPIIEKRRGFFGRRKTEITGLYVRITDSESRMDDIKEFFPWQLVELPRAKKGANALKWVYRNLEELTNLEKARKICKKALGCFSIPDRAEW